ncbi:ATP-binding cassette domain-containing protein [Enterococcus sp. RIT-PI-f]|uniref:ATP-binding cassette domain-containing protein n=1 Tax=Enterococcus sp. RIT-PI-f TaxID=1690244 RepID=UPI0009EC74EC|nr:ATP-binding cassette domain-containing protein [Enterococcus sp. RIT-PI-f]
MTLSIDISKQLFKNNLQFQHEITSQITSIQGISGAGKTTLLRIIAGLEICQKGTIFFQNQCWLDTQRAFVYPAYKRNIGFVMQEPTLFPTMTVEENILFSSKMSWNKKRVATDITERMHDHLKQLGLIDYRQQSVLQLSGGQKRRVALVRALLSQPQLLLLDEPFTGLDDNMLYQVLAFLKQQIKNHHLTTLLVSHGKEEVAFLTDVVISI